MRRTYELKRKIYEILSTVYILALEKGCGNDIKAKEVAVNQIMELIKEEKETIIKEEAWTN